MARASTKLSDSAAPGAKAPAARKPAAKKPADTNRITVRAAAKSVSKLAKPAPHSPVSEPRRQGDIADAAAQIFAEKGFHGASTQDIADVLGIRQASLYYYFQSKEEALRIVCEKGAAGFHECAQQILAGPGTSCEKIAALIAAHLAPLEDRANYVRVFLRERQYLPASASKIVNAHALGLESCFEAVIAQGIANGVFSPRHDPRLATLAILAMVNAVPFWRESRGGAGRRRSMARNAAIAAAAQEIAQIALGGLTGVAWYAPLQE